MFLEGNKAHHTTIIASIIVIYIGFPHVYYNVSLTSTYLYVSSVDNQN